MTTPVHDWDASYRGPQPPPWDIGRPQAAVVALAEQGRLAGAVLDAGCGTGEHALLAASRGAAATGVDLSQEAIRVARAKAAERRLSATFVAEDILVGALPVGDFDVVVDSGLFHCFDDDDRARYVTRLGTLLRQAGVCFLMCFSDRQPGDWGPRRVSRDEIVDAFADGWEIEAIVAETFDINPVFDTTKAAAWLVTLRRD